MVVSCVATTAQADLMRRATEVREGEELNSPNEQGPFPAWTQAQRHSWCIFHETQRAEREVQRVALGDTENQGRVQPGNSSKSALHFLQIKYVVPPDAVILV